MADIIVLAEVRKAREIARSADAVARQLGSMLLLFELLSAWLALQLAMARCMSYR